jgi:hypothetical protein
MVDLIANGESGASVRTKLNTLASLDNQYIRNGVAMAGDSRLQQWVVDPGPRKRKNAFNFVSMAMRLCGQRWRVVTDTTLSGQRSDQYLSAQNQATLLASNAY